MVGKVICLLCFFFAAINVVLSFCTLVTAPLVDVPVYALVLMVWLGILVFVFVSLGMDVLFRRS